MQRTELIQEMHLDKEDTTEQNEKQQVQKHHSTHVAQQHQQRNINGHPRLTSWLTKEVDISHRVDTV